ncbi:T9SS type A sorting domain-containing protein [uncultured Cytophaga sp.]|uniref:T9SS type A sorting domain-containing protein n=1 Tax=uncultured Cytophaga sp. TaxID=160238 RepID=UPI0026096E10|nr:T9SS type A sorting domain-containing protein [uncultured Cytophaga sp.]
MDKKVTVLFLLLALCVCRYSHAQTNPFYTVTQENIRPDYFNNFNFLNIGVGNTYNPIYPAYTTFLTDGYVLENITSSKHIQGLPIGFRFPYAGQEFDIYAINAKGYIVLGKSWEGGMTVYADTLIESSTDTVFTQKNKYLISGLYAGKNMDFTGSVYVSMYKGGFIGERRLYISLINATRLTDGAFIFSTNSFELKETGEMNIVPSVDIQNNAGQNSFNSYGSIIQRDGTGKDNYLFGVGYNSDAWSHTQQKYSSNIDFKYGILRDTILPPVTQQTYIIYYQPVKSTVSCPILIRWHANPPGVYADSAYIANDYEELEGDTLETSDRVWWYSDMRDSLRFDVYLGTDEVSMPLYKAGLESDTLEPYLYSFVKGMVKLKLDSLAPSQKYFLRIHSINPSGDTTVCTTFFYTKPNEVTKNYCRTDDYIFEQGNEAFTDCFLDLNTLHYKLDYDQSYLGLYYQTSIPDTGSWTTTLQQGQAYTLQLSCPKWNYLPATSFMVSVFMDYDQDGVFDHPDNNNDNHTFGISDTLYRPLIFSIPKNAVLGKTRLRIAVRRFCNNCYFPDPCLTEDTFFSDFTITIAAAPGCNLSYSDSIVTPNCATNGNGFLNVVVSGGIEPYHIQWNTGYSADTLFTLSDLVAPDRHRATITDAAGCAIRTAMLQMTQPLPLQVDTFFQTKPAFIVFSGGTRPYRAKITEDKTDTLYAVNDTIFLPDVSQGNFTIVATDKNACDPQTYVFSNRDTVNYIKEDFVLYPNPAYDYIQISGINQFAEIIIYSSDGKKIFEGISTNQQFINLSSISSGLYIVKVEEENSRNTFKLIVK